MDGFYLQQDLHIKMIPKVHCRHASTCMLGSVMAPLEKLDCASLPHMESLICWGGLSFYLIYNLNGIPPLNCNINCSLHGNLIKQAFASVDDGQRISTLISQVFRVEVQQWIDKCNHIVTLAEPHVVWCLSRFDLHSAHKKACTTCSSRAIGCQGCRIDNAHCCHHLA
jgi:hypothetical protein